MITAEADTSMNWLHHRMPVMLTPETLPEWLDLSTPETRLQGILASGLPMDLEAVPLQQRVNSGREKALSVLSPAGDSVTINRR
ncbi:MAG: hypothetical protein D6160_03875 [Ketobacter sp.]|mgnify:CR=1 FL=1|nr:MAG: hypothetical protein D6160_03875 [Ketobacter sp.]